MVSAVSDEFITCCTFGVLILRLRCLPLAVSASFTVTAFMEKTKEVHFYVTLLGESFAQQHMYKDV